MHFFEDKPSWVIYDPTGTNVVTFCKFFNIRKERHKENVETVCFRYESFFGVSKGYNCCSCFSLSANQIFDLLEEDDDDAEGAVTVALFPPSETADAESDADSDASEDPEGLASHLPRRLLCAEAEVEVDSTEWPEVEVEVPPVEPPAKRSKPQQKKNSVFGTGAASGSTSGSLHLRRHSLRTLKSTSRNTASQHTTISGCF